MSVTDVWVGVIVVVCLVYVVLAIREERSRAPRR